MHVKLVYLQIWFTLGRDWIYKMFSLPFIHNVQKIQHLTNIFTVTNSLLVWKDVKKYLSIPNKSPIAVNPDLPTPIQNIGL